MLTTHWRVIRSNLLPLLKFSQLYILYFLSLVFDFDNSNAILFYFLFVQENGNKKNIAHSEFISTHFIVVQPQKSLTKRKDFWAHGKVKIGKRHKSHSASNFTHIHTLCILFSSWIASVKQASCTVIWFFNFHSEIVWDKTCFEN